MNPVAPPLSSEIALTPALTVGGHFAMLFRGAKTADVHKGEWTQEEISDPSAGGEAMADLVAEIDSVFGDMNGIQTPAA